MSDDPNTPWLNVRRGAAPLLLCMPHTGTDIPRALEGGFVSTWLARRDTDWWIEQLYAFAAELGASLVRTSLSRSVIDMNRDPSGASLYPGQATTELCPSTTFDGQPLYREGCAPAGSEVAVRRREYFEPYHQAIEEEIRRLQSRHPVIVVYDCHSIRSCIPRLFAGMLPHFNLGTFEGASCSPALTAQLEAACTSSTYTRVTNGRFKGGYTTRHYGRPRAGVHAVQMELACRSYLPEPLGEVHEGNWPCAWDEVFATPVRAILQRVLTSCLKFATGAHP